MRVGFDISQTGPQKAGCGYFAHAMVEQLISTNSGIDLDLYTSFGDDFFDPKVSKTAQYSGNNVRYGPLLTNKKMVDQLWLSLSIETCLGHPDIIHSNNFWCPTQVESAKLVYTLYDLSFFVYPEWTTEENRSLCSKGVINASIFADRMIAISEYTKASFLEYFPTYPEEKIDVITPGSRYADHDQHGKKHRLLETRNIKEFWLCVGTLEPRKNQKTLLDAYVRYLDRTDRPIPFVFAGGKGWLMDDFDDVIASMKLADHVIVTGYVTDAELAWLYRNCRANFYPSHFEGFGLPVLEGMGFGVPSISSDATSLPEVIGDAGIVINPNDINCWAETMYLLSQNDSMIADMKIKSLEQAKKFSWQKSASALSAIYEKLMLG